MSNPTKHCSKCDQYLDLSFFGKNKQTKDGLTHWCKPCHNKSNSNYILNNKELVAAKHKVYRDRTGRDKIYYEANRERILAQKKVYQEENKDTIKEKSQIRYYQQVEEYRRRAREYHWANKDIQNPKHRKYHWANRDRILSQKRKYQSGHLDQAAINSANYRAAKFGCEGSFTVEEWRYVKEVNGNRCLKCGKAEPEIKLSIDHIIPLSSGGSNNIGNVQPLCLSCNKRKFTKTIDYRGRRLSRGKLRKSD